MGQPSIWTETLGAFHDQVGGTEPVPAGVSISAVSASLALVLFAKVLDITGKRKSFTGDRQALSTLTESARAESNRLKQLADQDVQAFTQYLESVREGNDDAGANRQTIDVPMNAARSAVRGLELCAEGAKLVSGLTAADLGIAAALLTGAFRAALISIEANIREMPADEQFSAAITAECRALEKAAHSHANAVTAGITLS